LGERLLRELKLELRDEFLNGEILYSLKEVQVLAERWRVHYNTIRPHSSLGYRSPAPEAWAMENQSHEAQEPGIATRFPALHASSGGLPVHQKLRYSNNPSGTQDRSGHRLNTPLGALGNKMYTGT
jgi:Integrase core domain